MGIPQIDASGSPFDIGYAHGSQAKPEIGRCRAFYADFLTRTTGRSWEAIVAQAKTFEPAIKSHVPHLYEELRGVSEGSGLAFDDVLVLNLRTEVAFGSYADGCTSAYVLNSSPPHGQTNGTNGTAVNPGPLQGQNWDWNPEQRENLVRLRITPQTGPKIDMVTEAGLIGKIGLNSAGVGVCLNALRAPGADPARLPTHLALRVALESTSREAAVSRIEKLGVSSAAYMLIGDTSGGTGLENTSRTCLPQALDADGLLSHSNHMLLAHGDASDGALALDAAGKRAQVFWADSLDRQPRAHALLRDAFQAGHGVIGAREFEAIFSDERGAPCAINRVYDGKDSQIETLFNVLFRLKEGRGVIKVGRIDAVSEVLQIGDWF